MAVPWDTGGCSFACWLASFQSAFEMKRKQTAKQGARQKSQAQNAIAAKGATDIRALAVLPECRWTGPMHGDFTEEMINQWPTRCQSETCAVNPTTKEMVLKIFGHGAVAGTRKCAVPGKCCGTCQRMFHDLCVSDQHPLDKCAHCKPRKRRATATTSTTETSTSASTEAVAGSPSSAPGTSTEEVVGSPAAAAAPAAAPAADPPPASAAAPVAAPATERDIGAGANASAPKKHKGISTWNRHSWREDWDEQFDWARRDDGFVWCFFCKTECCNEFVRY